MGAAMQKRERTIWLIASVIFGASFWLVAAAQEHGPLLVAWKGAGLALLAIHALSSPTPIQMPDAMPRCWP